MRKILLKSQVWCPWRTYQQIIELEIVPPSWSRPATGLSSRKNVRYIIVLLTTGIGQKAIEV